MVWHSPASVLPETFDGFRLLGRLGAGAMGRVYLALDTQLDRQVAIKVLEPSTTPERLDNEARALARIHHPNVVTIHRLGEISGVRYIAYERVVGQSLDALPKPVPTERWLSVAVDMTRGLAAVHARGVLHRDLKPANVMLAEDGAAKLIDFGLASLAQDPRLATTTEGAAPGPERAIVGTPSYLAPELWRGGSATVASDLYALGATLYELASGRRPYEAPTLAQLERAIGKGPPAPLSWVAPNLPSALARLVDRCLLPEPGARPAGAELLLAELEAELPRARALTLARDGPYRALGTFRREHRSVFFGRSREVAAVLERLRASALVVVTGDSGIGKSSLCRAGVLAEVEEGALGEGRRFTTLTVVPGREPLTALVEPLSRLWPGAVLDADELREAPETLARCARAELSTLRGLIVFVDQLEQLVSTPPPPDALVTARALAALADHVPGVRVLATARADRLTALAALPELGDRLRSALYVPAPLSAADLREVIVEPARLSGVRFGDEATVEALIGFGAARGAHLPLLEFALSQLWALRDAEAGVVPASALAAIGGVEGALGRHADAAMASMTPPMRDAARRLLVALVHPDGTLRRAPEAELLGLLAPEARDVARAALAACVDARLLVATPRGDAPDTTEYELIHEALAREWEALADWLRHDGERERLLGRLSRAAADWARAGRPPHALWSDAELRALGPAPQLAPPDVVAFVRDSRRAARRRRWQRAALIAWAPLVALLAWLGVTLRDAQVLEARVQRHLSEARQATHAAERALAEHQQHQATSFAAFDAGDPASGERAWTAAKAARARVATAQQRAGSALEAGLAVDGRDARLRRALAELLASQVELARRELRSSETTATIDRLRAYDPSGELEARLTRPGQLAVVVDPPGTRVSLARVSEGPERAVGPARELGTTPLGPVPIEAGVVTLELTTPTGVRVAYPLRLEPGRAVSLDFALPSSVPEDFVYVAPGSYFTGTLEDGALRTEIYAAAPLHPQRTGAYLIARHEVTFAEWLTFLRSLPPDERRARRPRGERAGQSLELSEDDGRFVLAFRPQARLLRAAEGEPLHYPGRTHRRAQDWRRTPVLGVSPDDARAFIAWRRAQPGGPAVRLCSEAEWERAARGADERSYPHGDRLLPDDANHDATYGRVDDSFGPDEVGTHPRSDSPFGVADLAGNAWELTETVRGGIHQGYASRGGGWYQAAGAAAIINREPAELHMRDPMIGLRLCADP